MSHQELEQGKAWVEGTIRRLARERGVEVTEPFQWHHDFDREVYWLEAVMNGVTKRWPISFEKLEDCVSDRNVQRDLQKALAFYVIPGNEESTPSPASTNLSEKGKGVPRRKPESANRSGVGLPDISRAPTRLLRVFLCHSSADKPAVRDLYQRLLADGADPWLDEEKILPGQDWELEIKKAVRESDAVIVCLTHGSVTREGFVQKEIKEALDVADQKPEGTIFVIPLKLEECIVPDRLRRWQWVNLFEQRGYEKLMCALWARASALGIEVPNQPIVKPNAEERSIRLIVQSVAFTTDFNGVAVVAHIENPTSSSDQVAAWELELPALGITLHGGPGASTFLVGAPWWPVPPFDLGPKKMTRGAVFFPGDPTWRGGLPEGPLRGKIIARLFLSKPLEQEVKIYTIKTLKSRELQQENANQRNATIRPNDRLSAEEVAILVAAEQHGGEIIKTSAEQTGDFLLIGPLNFPPDLNDPNLSPEARARWLEGFRSARTRGFVRKDEGNLYKITVKCYELIKKFKNSGKKTREETTVWQTLTECLGQLAAAQDPSQNPPHLPATHEKIRQLIGRMLELSEEYRSL